MTDTRTIAVTVNGSRYDLQVETRLTLVLFDGQAVRSCLMFAVQADGAVVTTVEGLASENGQLHPLQQAFHDNHGLQCGFCTPGVLMTLLEFLQHNPAPTEAEVREALSGNLCRCTGYQGIVAAALDAASRLRQDRGQIDGKPES